MEISEVVDLPTMGKFLAARRVSLGMGQDVLAARVGVSERAIRYVESGKPPSNPQPKILGGILSVLEADDFPTLLRFLRVINESRDYFAFPAIALPPGNRERFRYLLATLATIVNIQEVYPGAGFAELSVELLREVLDDGPESADPWVKLLRNLPTPPHRGRSEPSEGVLEMASVDS